jgi:hypothetical protein
MREKKFFLLFKITKKIYILTESRSVKILLHKIKFLIDW